MLSLAEADGIQESGTGSPLHRAIEHIEAMQPRVRLRERVEAGAEDLPRGGARSRRCATPTRRDSMHLPALHLPTMTQYGTPDTPSRGDNWPRLPLTGGAADAVDRQGRDRPRQTLLHVQVLRQTAIASEDRAWQDHHDAGGSTSDCCASNGSFQRTRRPTESSPQAAGGCWRLRSGRYIAHDRRGMGMHGRSRLRQRALLGTARTASSAAPRDLCQSTCRCATARYIPRRRARSGERQRSSSECEGDLPVGVLTMAAGARIDEPARPPTCRRQGRQHREDERRRFLGATAFRVSTEASTSFMSSAGLVDADREIRTWQGRSFR